MVVNKSKQKQKTRWEIFWEPMPSVGRKLDPSKITDKGTVGVLVLALLLPLAGWIVGVFLNPDGWMSRDPLIAYLYVAALLAQYWVISVPAIFVPIILILLLRLRPALAARLISFIVFIASLVISIIMMTLVKDASESEFTG